MQITKIDQSETEQQSHDDTQEPLQSTLPWQIKIFIFSLLVPSEASFYLGSFRLCAYRLVLLFFIIPCFSDVFSSKSGKTIFTDWFLLGYSCWVILSLSINHGFLYGLESGGILLIESLSAYLLARRYIRDEKVFASFVKLLILTIVGLSFFTIPEALTGKNLIRPNIGHIGARFGLERSFGPFDHPILYGVYCASITSLALFVPTKSFVIPQAYKLRTFWVVITTFMSVSSGALASIVVQFILATWKKLTKEIPSRWWLFSFFTVLCYIFIDILSNRTPMKVILHRLTFSADTAYNRLIIWEWGTKYNVAEHPLFGIGISDWVRPSWMHSTSMDNFWLVNMVRYGLPSFFLISCAVIYLLIAVNRDKYCPNHISNMQTGWSFSIIGLIIAGCTVHFWNSLYVWFFFLLGSGAWMATREN